MAIERLVEYKFGENGKYSFKRVGGVYNLSSGDGSIFNDFSIEELNEFMDILEEELGRKVSKQEAVLQQIQQPVIDPPKAPPPKEKPRKKPTMIDNEAAKFMS